MILLGSKSLSLLVNAINHYSPVPLWSAFVSYQSTSTPSNNFSETNKANRYAHSIGSVPSEVG